MLLLLLLILTRVRPCLSQPYLAYNQVDSAGIHRRIKKAEKLLDVLFRATLDPGIAAVDGAHSNSLQLIQHLQLLSAVIDDVVLGRESLEDFSA